VSPAVAELTAVRVTHGPRTTLDVRALSVLEGEILGVMGPNGAGKSTLLRILGLLETPTEGVVRFRGQPVPAARALAVRRRMASVFQDPLLADASVFDNVALGLRFRGVAAGEIGRRVLGWLERFDIAPLAHRHARTLSGGEAQRAALARALVVEPELLLLDEPFSALDQPMREALLRDLRGILRAERITTVLVTHHRGEALALGDRVAVLIDGRILQVGDSGEVFRAPVSVDVARFVGVETIVECAVIGRTSDRSVLSVGDHTVEVVQPAAPGERVLLCIRPEEVRVRPAASIGSGPDGGNRLDGTITGVMPAPLHVRVVIDCGFPLVALVTHRLVEQSQLTDGAPVIAEFSPSAAHLIRPGRPDHAVRQAEAVSIDTDR
jgi:tungstate transport system ATP-binding protein